MIDKCELDRRIHHAAAAMARLMVAQAQHFWRRYGHPPGMRTRTARRGLQQTYYDMYVARYTDDYHETGEWPRGKK